MPVTIKKIAQIPSEWIRDASAPRPEGFYGNSVIECNTAYGRRSGTAMTQIYGGVISSDVWGKYFQRFSSDNGQTWFEPIIAYEPRQVHAGTLRWDEGCFFLDEEKDRLLHFVNYSVFSQDRLTIDALKTTRIMVRVSGDGGHTFAESLLIQQGGDEVNWADGVTFGANRAYVSFPAPLKLKNGDVLLPVARTPRLNDNDSPFLLREEAGCMIGKWNDDRIEWTLSALVTVAPARSSRGLCEPTFAEMGDGTIMMIARGSNHGLNGAPGHKWQSLSRDGGHTWSEPVPWRYQTGEPFFSPASGSRLIRDSRNEKLYWFGNITPTNPNGNAPRHPLILAEVDESSMCLVKDTLAIIDDRTDKDGEDTQLSNFRVYQDRISREFVLNLARIGERGGKDRTSPSYQYRVQV